MQSGILTQSGKTKHNEVVNDRKDTMGMFDYFRPNPDIGCPVCGQTDLEWQGADGPCALFVWVQGQASPIDQIASDDSRISRRDSFRLPARFEIFADCRCPTSLAAVGVTKQGVWTQTELLNPLNAVAYPYENERDFKQRLDFLAERSGHAGRT